MSDYINHRLPWKDLEKSVEDIYPASRSPHKLVSFDFDFFVSTPNANVWPDPERVGAASDVLIEDWASSKQAAIVWKHSYEEMSKVGFAPEHLVEPLLNPNKKYLKEVEEALKTNFVLSKADIADSHVWGAYAALRASKAADQPIEIVHFDMHHDCGYVSYYRDDTPELARARAYLAPSCEDWLQVVLLRGICSHATIVYPDWDGGDWEYHPPTLPDILLPRISKMTFSEWRERNQKAKTEDVALLLARSSNFLPPWGGADKAFLDFAHQLVKDKINCLDCNPPAGLKVGESNACQPRPHPNDYEVEIIDIYRENSQS